MKTTHTPGPWFINGPWHIQADLKTEIPVVVAQVTPMRSGNPDERTANARLIAAAPELAESLRCLVTATENNGVVTGVCPVCGCRECVDTCAVETARAALAKAGL